MKKILERRKDRLQMLLDVVEDQLDQQKKVLESELLEVQLKSKVAAGKAANAAMNVLLNAVRASIT